MIVPQDLIGMFIVPFTHIADHLFQPFIGLGDPHTVTDRVLADADLLGEVVFVDTVDAVVVQDPDDLHVHVSVCDLPGVRVGSGGAHPHHLLLDPVRVFFMAPGGEDQLKCSALQQFPELVDVPDILVRNFSYCDRPVIIRDQKAFRLQLMPRSSVSMASVRDMPGA